MNRIVMTVLAVAALSLTGCNLRVAALPAPERVHAIPRDTPHPPRPDAAANKLADGFRSEVVIHGLTYPTSVEFDDEGVMHIAESGYAYGDHHAPARVLRLSNDGEMTIVTDQLNGPVTDLLWHDGKMYVSHRGKISVIEATGSVRDLVTGLPSLGDHHNNQLAAGRDGKIYFGQGTVTNSGVVGLDNFLFLWLPLYPDFHETPAKDIELRDTEFTTINPFILGGGKGPMLVKTAPFQRFGGGDAPGKVKGAVKAGGTILRMDPDGANLEVHAWGLRNPFGVAFGNDGKLYASNNGFDGRGSRPIANDTESLYAIEKGAWYGWPDFASGEPVTDERFKPENGPQPQFLMKDHPPVKKPLMTFPSHAAATKLAANASDLFGGRNDLFLGFFGHMTPATGREPAQHGGHRVLRIDPSAQRSEVFFANARGQGHGGGDAGLQHPVDVVFSPDGQAMYVVDFGHMKTLKSRVPMPAPVPATGVIWRIVRHDAATDELPKDLSLLPSAAAKE